MATETPWPDLDTLTRNHIEVLKRKCDRVRELEEQHGMTSSEMRRELAEGGIAETAEVAEWLMALELIAMLKRCER